MLGQGGLPPPLLVIQPLIFFNFLMFVFPKCVSLISILAISLDRNYLDSKSEVLIRLKSDLLIYLRPPTEQSLWKVPSEKQEIKNKKKVKNPKINFILLYLTENCIVEIHFPLPFFYKNYIITDIFGFFCTYWGHSKIFENPKMVVMMTFFF